MTEHVFLLGIVNTHFYVFHFLPVCCRNVCCVSHSPLFQVDIAVAKSGVVSQRPIKEGNVFNNENEETTSYQGSVVGA